MEFKPYSKKFSRGSIFMDKPTLKTNQLIFVRALTVLSLLRFCSSCCPFTLARRSRPGSGQGGEAQVSQVS